MDLTPTLTFTATATVIKGCCGLPDTECPNLPNCSLTTSKETP